MKTTLELETILYQFLVASALKAQVTGDVYKRKRPIGSRVEDIVIISLPVTGEAVQSAVVNVNIHVPNMQVFNNGATDSVPDTARLEVLTRQAVDLLREGWDPKGAWNWQLQQQHIFEDEGQDNHYSNIRLDFHSINLL